MPLLYAIGQSQGTWITGKGIRLPTLRVWQQQDHGRHLKLARAACYACCAPPPSLWQSLFCPKFCCIGARLGWASTRHLSPATSGTLHPMQR